MKNKIIIFANIKGGVGKSTLCVLFAHYLTKKGEKVAVVDADAQKSIVRNRMKDLQSLPTAQIPWEVVSVFDFSKDGNAESILSALNEEEGWILIDCPGNLEAERIESLLLAADAAVVPLSYEYCDMDATVELFVPIFKEINPKAKIIFVPNRINEKMQKDMDMIRKDRERARGELRKLGWVTGRIKDSVVFETHRFNTLKELEENQEKGVMYPFNDIINQLKD